MFEITLSRYFVILSDEMMSFSHHIMHYGSSRVFSSTFFAGFFPVTVILWGQLFTGKHKIK